MTECSNNMTERSNNITERSNNITERSNNMTERSNLYVNDITYTDVTYYNQWPHFDEILRRNITKIDEDLIKDLNY